MPEITPQPQVGDPVHVDQASTDDKNTPTTEKTYDEAYVKQLRQEAAGYRTKLSTFERQEEERRQATLSETQKATERAENAEKALSAAQERNARLAIEYKAQVKGAVDAQAVTALLDRSTFDVNDDAALDKAIDDLLTAKSYLKAAQEAKPQAPKTSPISPGKLGRELSYADLGKMSRAELDRLPNDVFEAAMKRK